MVFACSFYVMGLDGSIWMTSMVNLKDCACLWSEMNNFYLGIKLLILEFLLKRLLAPYHGSFAGFWYHLMRYFTHIHHLVSEFHPCTLKVMYFRWLWLLLSLSHIIYELFADVNYSCYVALNIWTIYLRVRRYHGQ